MVELSGELAGYLFQAAEIYYHPQAVGAVSPGIHPHLPVVPVGLGTITRVASYLVRS